MQLQLPTIIDQHNFFTLTPAIYTHTMPNKSFLLMEQQIHILCCSLAAISLFFFLTATSAAPVCNRNCSSFTVPFPFGFSDGCNITLNCSNTGQPTIGEFKVRNITSESILLDVPLKCNRSMDSFNSLFTKNFMPTTNNSLFLKECPAAKYNTSACDTGNFIFQDRECGNSSRDSISVCFSDMTSPFYPRSVPGTGCGVLYTSMFFEDLNTKVVKLETMELGWWMPSPCHCSKHAENFMVGTKGCRCSCLPGFKGDGFARGLGCKKAICSVSKYWKGTCGAENRLIALVAGVVGGALVMALLVLLWCQIHRRSSCRRQRKSLRHLLSQNSCTVPLYSHKVIEMATNCFSDTQLLGTGAYGKVYAGKLCNKLVAIKRIKNRGNDSIEQVMNEIKLLSSVDHPNLVQLLGCCIEGGEQILVYEFMPNGTLAQHLQRERGPAALPWTVRLTIATETARAIAYLHSVVHPPIYHRDIKSSNILLDYNYNSKVADFGLSRIGMTESSHVSTAPQGTPGYVDPQYHQNFHLSDKSDVYSFGVVLVEIITALKAIDFSRGQSEVNLAALAINRISKGNLNQIIDPFLDPQRDEWTLSSIHKVAELAFRCLAYQREIRPSMIEVADELKQIQLSGWAPAVSEDNVFMSTASSFCSSPSSATERSCGTSSKSRRLVMLGRLEEVEVESPVSVDGAWFSEQSSPSEHSLLSNIAR